MSGSSKATNYWTWKDSELMGEFDRRGLKREGERFSRKATVEALLKHDLENGLSPAMFVSQEGKDSQPGIDLLKSQNPQLIVSRVIFHNTGENDMPYVFVGHNGTSFYIPKEVEVDVPDYILQSCIKDAIEDRLYPQQNMDGSITWRVKRVQRFPYTIVRASFPA